MAKDASLELLELVLANHRLDEAALAGFLKRIRKERLHVDWKHGDELKKSDAGAEVRKNVTAFANSDGGVLIIGVEDRTKAFTGCPSVGSALDVWTGDVLRAVHGHFASPPRIQIVSTSNGDVLVIGVQRNPHLLGFVQAGSVKYAFRMEDGTSVALDYLVSDLLLGRRTGPQITADEFSTTQHRGGQGAGYSYSDRESFVTLANNGLTWCDEVMVGMISHSIRTAPDRIPDTLLREIDVTPADLPLLPIQFGLQHTTSWRPPNTIGKNDTSVEPFTRKPQKLAQPFSWPDRVSEPYVIRAAVYVLPRGSPAEWYQATIHFRHDPGFHGHRIERCWNGRPTVSLRLNRR